MIGGCARIRTLDPLIKSQLLLFQWAPRRLPDHPAPKNTRGPRTCRCETSLLCNNLSAMGLVVHAAHSTHAAPPPALPEGASAIMASVVIRRPATDAAPWSAARTTFAGLTMPAWSMSYGMARPSFSVSATLPDLK